MSKMNLAGIHAKFSRAERHIQTITDEADKLCEDVLAGIVREVLEDVDEQVWVYRGETPKVPLDWSVIIGEILHNLRSSLDHLVWQLVLDNGHTPGRLNEFPITTDCEGWGKAKKRGSLKGVSQKHEELIARLQPYTGGMGLPFNVAMLEAIRKLSNIEKHRHLVVAVVASNGTEPLLFGVNHPELDDSNTRSPLKGTEYLSRIETGKVLLRFNNADTPLCPSFRIATRFAYEEQHWTGTRSVPDLLSEYHRAVKGAVEFVTGPHVFVGTSTGQTRELCQS